METLTLNNSATEQDNYCDLRQYETIPALDEAIAELGRGEYFGPVSFEEYLIEIRKEDES